MERLQLKPLDRIRWCCCLGNRTAAFIVAAVELAWLVALAIVVIWRWALEDRVVGNSDPLIIEESRIPPSEVGAYVAWVQGWFRAITAVMFVAFVAGLASNICLIIGLKKMRVELITVWLVVTACLMVLVILFFLLPLIFGGKPTYSAFIEFLIDAWFFVIVLGAREDTKLAVYESAQMRYQTGTNGLAPSTTAFSVNHDGNNTTNNGTTTNNIQWSAASVSAAAASPPPPATPPPALPHQYYHDAGVTSQDSGQYYARMRGDDDDQHTSGANNSNNTNGDLASSSAAAGGNNYSNFDIDGGDFGRNHHHRQHHQFPTTTASDVNSGALSFPIGAAPAPVSNSPAAIFQRLKARFTRR